ncbi:hypothetical protein [Mangrovibacterium sp.]|uniref:hypothetical protein n=1 Tax=Mangrovibacterium sp. TaxID=1961364 RepID=UPI00356238F1
MTFLRYAVKLIFPVLLLVFFSGAASAGNPVVKIDFNQSGRNINQVNEPGYESWVNYGAEESNTYSGIKFTLSGDGLKSIWYKAGINDAKLVSDGVTVNADNDKSEILLTISGLSTGSHSLLVFLNQVDSPEANSFCPIDILVNGQQVVDNIQPSVRTTSNYKAGIAYFNFTATAGEDVNIIFKTDTQNGAATNKNVILNGLELNTPNILDQAINPSPANVDEHVEADNNSIVLAWTADDEAVSHNVYFSDNRQEVESATTADAAFKKSQTDTTYTVSDLNSHASYYWRIDEQKADGTVTKGNVWTFRLAHLAFPGAEGYGRFARGGRGGKVVHVTNLNDDGEGSFRYAIEKEKGPRTIVFDVSGLITLNSRLVLSDSYVTIAGQTAPGKGICLRDAPFGLSGADDVIVQNIRVRRGSRGDFNWGLDGMGMQGSNNSIIDHCSISWTIDESFSSRSGKNISLQRTLISEALNVAGHPNYPEGKGHGYAASIGGDVGSFHHNLLAHCEGRNWSLAGGLDGNAYYSGRLDLRNNVVYNWGHRTTDGGAMEVNFVGNYYKPGAATDLFYALTMDHEGVGHGSQRAFFTNNVMPGYFDETNQEDGRRYKISNNAIVDWETFVSEPFFESYVETQTAKAAYKDVLSDVGCNAPTLDDHDIRVIGETLSGTYSIKGSKSGKPGLPDNEQDVGGWETYPELKREANWDSDGDGLPNWWEKQFKLNQNSPESDFSEANLDSDGDGYTMLEDYLQWMAKPHYFIKSGTKMNIDLVSLFRGYTDSPSFEVISVNNLKVRIKGQEAAIRPMSSGLASVTIKVTDAAGDTKEREVVVFIANR